LRIALVHSFYSSRQPSGENAVVESEFDALRRAGYVVQLFAAHTDHLEGSLLYPIRAALRVATGRGTNPLTAIRRFRPDIVHIHNLFPNFGRRWVENIDVPVIHTVHNFRPLCANGLLFRDGQICTDCLDGRRWSGVRHACYRGSRIATIPSAWAHRRGPMADPLFRRADRLFMLTERQREIYVQAGVPRGKTVVAPNFLPDQLDPGPPAEYDRHGTLFVGRLSEEKGIVRLLDEWPRNQPLVIIGDGPLRHEVEERARTHGNINFLGAQSRRDVLRAMQRHRRLVFPSGWLEGFPVIYVEALACGLPIVAFQPSVLADIAPRDGTGVGVSWDGQWLNSLSALGTQPSHFLECRKAFEKQYSEAAFLRRVEAVTKPLADEQVS